jgi:hypothetical protein
MHDIEKLLPQLGGNQAAIAKARTAVDQNRSVVKNGDAAAMSRAVEELSRVLNSLRTGA